MQAKIMRRPPREGRVKNLARGVKHGRFSGLRSYWWGLFPIKAAWGHRHNFRQSDTAVAPVTAQ